MHDAGELVFADEQDLESEVPMYLTNMQNGRQGGD